MIMEALLLSALKAASSAVILGFLCFLIRLYRSTWVESRKIGRKLAAQGIQGPPPSFLYGNVPEMHRIQSQTIKSRGHGDIIAHDYTSTLFPYLDRWRKVYGQLYTYSTGLQHHLYVNDPELVKDMNQSMTLELGKVSYITKKLQPMLGTGIIRSNGLHWAHQRKIVAPEFFMDKVKGMVGLMVESTLPVVRKWEELIDVSNEDVKGLVADIEVDEDLRAVSADVISRACFGSSYSKGKEIFSKLRSLQKAIAQQSFLFDLTGLSDMVFGSKKHSKVSSLEAAVDSLIWETVKEREKECLEKTTQDKDLMQLILENAMIMNNNDNFKVSPRRFIVDNCKSIYFAGHETTAVAASWCLMLLALNPSWQSLIREEVARFCKNGLPDADLIPHLKTLTMVIQETLRLYPPAAFVSREALSDTRIGSILVPKGVSIWTLIPTLHRDPEIWGPDANEFKPERFSHGVSKACKYPQAYVPFGLGTRICLGKNFAMVELKVMLSIIVSRFSFSLAPRYRHSPTFRMIVEPEHGVLLRITKVS